MTPISKVEAKAAGMPRFFTGRPCVNGHIAERHTNGGACTVCVIESTAKRSHAIPAGSTWAPENGRLL